MAKQEVKIKLPMKCQKSRSCAMKIAVGVYGVESAVIQGDNKDEIVVTGEGVDPVKLTRLLRKKFCYANLVGVGDVKKKEEKKEEEEKKEKAIVEWLNRVPHYNYPVYQYEDPYNCSIM